MLSYIVFLNDWAKAVILDSEERANQVMKALKDDYYEKNKGSFRSYESYERICYWHVDTVEVVD